MLFFGGGGCGGVEWGAVRREGEGGDQSYHSQREWPMEETASNGTHTQTTHGHHDLETESAQCSGPTQRKVGGLFMFGLTL